MIVLQTKIQMLGRVRSQSNHVILRVLNMSNEYSVKLNYLNEMDHKRRQPLGTLTASYLNKLSKKYDTYK